MFPIGSIVGTQRPLHRHLGIASDRFFDGEQCVICVSPEHGGIEQPLSQFARGRPVYVDGYPSDLPPAQVLANARCHLGTPYNLFINNCEHLVRDAHGLPRTSPQVIVGCAAVMFIAIMLICGRGKAA